MGLGILVVKKGSYINFKKISAASKCLNCGYCCKQAPCPFGTWNPIKHECTKLVQKGNKYYCGIADYISKQPGANMSLELTRMFFCVR